MPHSDAHLNVPYEKLSAAFVQLIFVHTVTDLVLDLLQVALKTLIVIHRALREVDPTFREELINYGKSRNHMLNLSHFKDDSSAYGIHCLQLTKMSYVNKQSFSCMMDLL